MVIQTFVRKLPNPRTNVFHSKSRPTTPGRLRESMWGFPQTDSETEVDPWIDEEMCRPAEKKAGGVHTPLILTPLETGQFNGIYIKDGLSCLDSELTNSAMTEGLCRIR